MQAGCCGGSGMQRPELAEVGSGLMEELPFGWASERCKQTWALGGGVVPAKACGQCTGYGG